MAVSATQQDDQLDDDQKTTAIACYTHFYPDETEFIEELYASCDSHDEIAELLKQAGIKFSPLAEVEKYLGVDSKRLGSRALPWRSMIRVLAVLSASPRSRGPVNTILPFSTPSAST